MSGKMLQIGNNWSLEWDCSRFRSVTMDQSELDKYICKEQPTETKGYYMQQTMMRIKDPRKSLDFYTRVLGMRLLYKADFPEAEFTLFFMGYAWKTQIVNRIHLGARLQLIAGLLLL